MTTTQPSNGSSLPEKMVNPIFPPTSHVAANGIRPPSFPPNSVSRSPQVNAPIFPPNLQPPTHPNNLKTNTTSSSSPNSLNENSNPTPPIPNTHNRNVNPISSPLLTQSATVSPTQSNPTSPLPNTSNINGNLTPSLTSAFSANHNATPPPLPSATSSFNTFGSQANPTPPPLPHMYPTNTSATPPVPNTLNNYANPIPSQPNMFNANVNPIGSASSAFTANPNSNSSSPATFHPFNNTHANATPPLTNVYNINSHPTPPLPNFYNANANPARPQFYGHAASVNTIPSVQTPFNANQNSTPPPPLPPPPSSSSSSNIYNSSSTHPTALSQPSIRPMYPTPSPAYYPQVSQLPAQPIPQTVNQNAHTSSLPPPPPPPSSSSTYPYSQYNQNSNSAVSGHFGQQPHIPQPVSYPTSGSASNSINSQNNNFSGPSSNADMVDLLKETDVISPYAEEPPISPLLTEENQQMNCNPEVMRCSLNVIPQTKELLNKSRLPLGILIHPFKDLESLSVIQGSKIVRCDSCKSYINPFITFLDNTRWRCSICFRVNDLPQEFLFDPVTKTYGDPSRRPEVRFGTVEYTATADYMARPPQPAMYLFLLDVSHNAIQTGYLQSFCDILLENLNSLPGDARTQIGFLTYDSRLHYYDLSDRQNGSFRVMIVPDLDNKPEDFLPMPDGLLVTLCDNRTIIETFLNELPKIYQDNHETDSALGSALQIASKLLGQTGGRVTVIQTRIPNLNPGALSESVGSGGNAGKEPTTIAPTSDFYKKLSLDYASLQIACDLFLLNSHYIDLATLSCIAKYSGGEIKYYPGYHSVQKPHEVERFENDLRRYLQRKIGFEAVMRLRSPPALSINTFYGSGFVRSVDLLVLPNINPDAAFGIQVSIEDNIANYTTVTFQAALLYTSSKSERRIRVHTLSLPVSSNLREISSNADQEAITSLIAKMAADRSATSSIQEAREAMSNVACDIMKASLAYSSNRAFSLMVPYPVRLIPLYMLSMIKSTAFRAASISKVDDRAYYLELCKTLPTQYLLQIFYPDLYPIHTIEDKSQIIQDGEDELHIPQRVHLSFRHIDSHGAYILDASEYIYIYIGKAISDHFVQNVFNVQTFSALPFDSYSLPEFENPLSMKIHNFLSYLIQSRPHGVAIHIMREDSSHRHLFTRYLVDDKSESTMSYIEFLRYIREQIIK
ncbi:hypothetical protein I4U23_019039 [Adineta vaga]|nr:hypothetical protein I4U23_019039 [Adineta vaga]